MTFRVASGVASLGARRGLTIQRNSGLLAASLFLALLLPVAHAKDQKSIQIPALSSSMAGKTLLTDSVRLSDRVVAVGSNGVIAYSRNGTEWIQAQVPTQVLLTTVFFVDDKEGWAAGHDTLILHTKDGGETWAIQYEDPITGGDLPKPILDIHFDDKLHGWAIGAFSLLLETRDGGATWETADTGDLYDLLEGMELEPEPNFNAFHRMDDGFFIVGELGTLLHYRIAPKTATGDADGTDPAAVEPATDPESESDTPEEDEQPADSAGPWRVFESPYAGSFFGVNQLRDGQVMIYGLRGHLFSATRLGEPWVEIDTGGSTANINDVIELDSGEVIAVGSGGAMFRVDLSANRATSIRYGGFDGFVSVQSDGPNQLLLFGDAGAKVFNLPQP